MWFAKNKQEFFIEQQRQAMNPDEVCYGMVTKTNPEKGRIVTAREDFRI